MKSLKEKISDAISKLDEASVETGQYYAQSMDYLQEMTHSIIFIHKPSLDHVDNNHKALLQIQAEELA